MDRIDWVIANCRLLAQIGDEFDRTRPFAGLTIGTGIHLEPKTVALLLTLQRGGADVVATGNLNTTQQSAIDYLAARGVRVIGAPTSDPVEHDRRSCCSTTAAISSFAGSKSHTTDCSAGRRRRPRAARASSRYATASVCRYS